ncbi:hypothetical protein N9X61_02765 [Sulfurimonas sp.]|nr:hypothetical protein [Sulfurimonas sp.]
MWINKFKIALIQKDADAIESLLEDVPSFSSKQEIQEVMYLIEQATEFLYVLQDEITLSKKKIKQNINFLGTTLSNSSSNFNIKS